MKHYIGLDVSMKETNVCIVDELGKVVEEKTLKTSAEILIKHIEKLKYDVALIGLESGSYSHWLTEEFLKACLPIKCIDARHCAAILSMKINKTDRNDARGIAEVMRCGFYREVQLKTKPTRALSSLLTSRKQLVSQRVKMLMTIRGILKPFGIQLGSISRTKSGISRLWKEICAFELDESVLFAIENLIDAVTGVIISLSNLDKRIQECVEDEPNAQLLMSIPGVGPVTALKYLVEIGDPKRFKKSRSVGAYIGLTPTQYSSGETQKQGRISKCGSKDLRTLLVEAAIVLLTRTQTWSKLKVWGLRLVKKNGLKKGATAVARKLAVIMHTMILKGEGFRFGELKDQDMQSVA